MTRIKLSILCKKELMYWKNMERNIKNKLGK